MTHLLAPYPTATVCAKENFRVMKRWSLFFSFGNLLSIFAGLFFIIDRIPPSAYLGLLTEKWSALPTRGEPVREELTVNSLVITKIADGLFFEGVILMSLSLSFRFGIVCWFCTFLFINYKMRNPTPYISKLPLLL